MTKYEQSALIGFWRCGATMEEMCYASGKSKFEIECVIDEYLEKLKNELCLREN